MVQPLLSWMRSISVGVILRPGKTPSGVEVRNHLRRLIRWIRAHWPDTRITIRGDSHYGRPEVMAWCDANAVRFVFGLSGNAVLDALVEITADAVRTRRAIGANARSRHSNVGGSGLCVPPSRRSRDGAAQRQSAGNTVCSTSVVFRFGFCRGAVFSPGGVAWDDDGIVTFVGDAEEVHRQVRDLADQSQADEVMITTTIHSYELRRRSYELLAKALGKVPIPGAEIEVKVAATKNSASIRISPNASITIWSARPMKVRPIAVNRAMIAYLTIVWA